MKKILPKKMYHEARPWKQTQLWSSDGDNAKHFFSACVKVPSNTRRASHCKLRNSALEF